MRERLSTKKWKRGKKETGDGELGRKVTPERYHLPLAFLRSCAGGGGTRHDGLGSGVQDCHPLIGLGPLGCPHSHVSLRSPRSVFLVPQAGEGPQSP